MIWNQYARVSQLLVCFCCVVGALGDGIVCMQRWVNRLGNNLQQLENALVHSQHVGADLLKLPERHSDAPLYRLLNLPPLITLLPNSVQSSNACEPCTCCGDFTDLEYTCGKITAHQRRVVALTFLEPLLTCKEHPSEWESSTSVLLHMRSGDVMIDSTPSGWYPQPPCSFYSRIVERGLHGSPYTHIVVLTEGDRRNPCAKFMEDEYGAIVRSSNVQDDACLMTSSNHVALSFGSWGPSLTRLNRRIQSLFIPFGRESGAAYSGMLSQHERKRHYDGWAASWPDSIIVDGVSFEQWTFSFPGFDSLWFDFSDRSEKMTSYSQDLVVASRIQSVWLVVESCAIPSGGDMFNSPQWMTLADAKELCESDVACRGITHAGGVSDGPFWAYFKDSTFCHSADWTSYTFVSSRNKSSNTLMETRDIATTLTTSVSSSTLDVAGHHNETASATFHGNASAYINAMSDSEEFLSGNHVPCVSRNGPGYGEIKVCAIRLRHYYELQFFANRSEIFTLELVQVSNKLLHIRRVRHTERNQLECLVEQVDRPKVSSRLLSGRIVAQFHVYVHIEANAIVHAHTYGRWAPGEEFNKVMLQFRISGETSRSNFRYLPNLHNSALDVTSDHFFRSPAAIATLENGAGIAVLPDISVLSQSRLLPHALDLRISGNLDSESHREHWQMLYGLAASKLVPHMYSTMTGQTSRAPHGTFQELFALQLLVVKPTSPSDIVSRVTSYLWERYGRQHLLGDVRPQVLPFEEYGRKYAYVAHLARFAISFEGGMWGIDNPGRNGSNFDAWENDAMVAFGLQHYADKWTNANLQNVASGMLHLGLHAPSQRGAFPAIFDPRKGEWQLQLKTLGHMSGANQCSADQYYNVAAMGVTMWQYLYILEIYTETPHRTSILSRLRDFVSLLIGIQRTNGAIPHWIHSQTFVACDQLRESAVTALAGAVLAKAAIVLEDNAEEIKVAALKAADFVSQEVLPQQRFFDFETFFSCSPKAEDWKDELSGIFPQNSLSIQWTADMFLALRKVTGDASFLESGEFAINMLSLYQQVWSPNYFRREAYMFGGFGVMNTDAEWSDGRAHRFVFTYVDYYLATGNWEYLERGVAAARAGFTNMHIPENHKANVSNAAGPLEPENLEHFDEHDKGQWTGFTWGSGGALAATAYLERKLGGVWVDLESKRAMGIDGVTAEVLSASPNHVSLSIRSELHTTGFMEPFGVVIRSSNSDMIDLEVNSKALGQHRLSLGVSVSVETWPGGVETVSPPVLLSDAEVQSFIVHGALLLKPTVPEELHETIASKASMIRQESSFTGSFAEGEGNNIFPYIPELMDIYSSPEVHGALESLLGKDYVMHAHRHAHLSHVQMQNVHQDSFFGSQTFRPQQLLWVMGLYFPQDTTLEMGPTAVVTGSQYASFEHRFRYNGEGEVLNRSRAKALPGNPQKLCVTKGSVVVMHYDLYHHASQRLSATLRRWMFKFQFYRVSAPKPSWDHVSMAWMETQQPFLAACRETPEQVDNHQDQYVVWKSVWNWLCGQSYPSYFDSHDPLKNVSLDTLLDASVLELEQQRVAHLLRLHDDGPMQLLVALLFASTMSARRAAMHALVAAVGNEESLVQHLVDIIQAKWKDRQWSLNVVGRCCSTARAHDLEFAATAILSFATFSPGSHGGLIAFEALVDILKASGARNAQHDREIIMQERTSCMEAVSEFRLCEGGSPPLQAIAAEGVGNLGMLFPDRAEVALRSILSEYINRRTPSNIADFDDGRVAMVAARGLARLAARRKDRWHMQDATKQILLQALSVATGPELTTEMRGQPKDFRRYLVFELFHAISWCEDLAILNKALDLLKRQQPSRMRGLFSKGAVDSGHSFRKLLRWRVCQHTLVGAMY